MRNISKVIRTATKRAFCSFIETVYWEVDSDTEKRLYAIVCQALDDHDKSDELNWNEDETNWTEAATHLVGIDDKPLFSFLSKYPDMTDARRRELRDIRDEYNENRFKSNGVT